MNEFLDFFPKNLSIITSKREKDFRIECLPDTRPIYISSYHMVSVELIKLREELTHLLVKGLRPRMSP